MIDYKYDYKLHNATQILWLDHHRIIHNQKISNMECTRAINQKDPKRVDLQCLVATDMPCRIAWRHHWACAWGLYCSTMSLLFLELMLMRRHELSQPHINSGCLRGFFLIRLRSARLHIKCLYVLYSTHGACLFVYCPCGKWPRTTRIVESSYINN